MIVTAADPWYTRVVNRRLGRGLAAFSAVAGLGPHALTLLSALASTLGAGLLMAVPPRPVTAVVVVLLLQLGFALDSADGQLARRLGRTSGAGEWLDHVVDAGRILFVHGAVGVALLRHSDLPVWWLVLPAVLGWSASVRFFAQVLADQLRRRGETDSRPSGPAWVQLPADAGVVNLVLLLWPWPHVFLLGYGALAVAHALLLTATLRRTWRELVSS